MNASLELRQILNRIGTQFRQLRLWSGLAVCWVAFAILGIVVSRLALPPESGGRTLAAVVAISAGLVGLAWWLLVRRTARDPRWVARQIEGKHPDLSALLLTAVEQESAPGKPLGFLQVSIVESALAHHRSHHWDRIVPRRGLRASHCLHSAALAGLLVTLGVLGFRDPAPASAGGPAGAGASAEISADVQVEPGNTEIERGSPLLVIARFRAPVPAEANLVVEGADLANSRPMFRSLDDPLFSGHVSAVDADLSYRVEFATGRSETYRVKVYEHPALRRLNAHLAYPAFTNLEPKTVEDVRHVTAVEGTEVTLFCQLNKLVAKAVLIDEKKAEMPLTLHDADKPTYRIALKPTASQRYRLSLTDADGRSNKLPTDITINVTANRPPVVTVPRPGRDVRVSPLEETPLKADMKDDFGLVRYGISVTAPDQTAREIVMHETAPKQILKKAQPDYLLDLEALKAQPDQVVSYYFWAEDLGPDGKRRRTSGDMYFAEVRHFEEIFRQAEQRTRQQQEEREQQEREQGGNGQEADQLAELQKQIVNATWKLIRRETGETPTEKFAEDVGLIRETQKSVIEKAGQLAEKLQLPESVEHLNRATKFMKQAEEQLAMTAEKGTPATLTQALASEQAAYQALLKLRAREFQVARNNSRQRQNSRSASNNSRGPSQQQLQQLDLAQEENRYETESSARARQEQQAQRDREQRENQELADRLKELARRQTDLTDRVKELQSALEQAQDPKKKEELQQQLKRLQDQQRQLLRDTDELQERTERPENQERMADARNQLEQGREQQRQAAESMEKGQLSQAVNEGTRATRQLEDLREQLRKESANRFGEELRDLRQQARQLDDEQQKLTKQLDEMKQNPKPALRDSERKEQIQKGLEGQQKQFDQIAERIQKTVEEAEKPEPLLAQQLFDTTRNAAEQKLGESLNLARQLAETGDVPSAADVARKAAEGTEQLRKGIEKAADNLLGGRTEELKRAQRELDDLTEQLEREMAQATGRPQPQRGQNPKEGDPQANGEWNRQGQQPGNQNQQAQQGQQGQQQGQQGQQEQQGQQGRQQGQGRGGERAEPEPKDGQPGQGGGDRPMNPGQNQPEPKSGQGGGRRSLTDPPTPNRQANGNEPRQQQGTREGGGGPIREGGFREWTERLRATENLLEDPQLRAEAERIRDRVRTAREEFKRHAKEPDWKQIQDLVMKPMQDLRARVAEEIRRREAPDSLVPIDRDPVPPQFTDGVRRYYERLGGNR